jgi:hypothetical protein
MTLRTVQPILENKPLKRAPVPPPPKIAWLSIEQLVIDESYQRALSGNGLRLIRRLVETWDWNCFKPLSVAPAADGRYEVIDGQHTAMAAATHGSIEMLPCIVLTAETRAARSAAFVGINRDRVPLTPYALFRAKLAAEDPEAVAVDEALALSGGELVETLRYDEDYAPGVVACVSTLLQIVRRGGKARLARLLKMAIAAEIGPVPSGLLKGLEEIIRAPGHPPDADLIAKMSDLGGETILDQANERRKRGLASDQASAVAQVLLVEVDKMAA